jgi:hypothetical protein
MAESASFADDDQGSELSGFEIDEDDQILRKRPPKRWHG